MSRNRVSFAVVCGFSVSALCWAQNTCGRCGRFFVFVSCEAVPGFFSALRGSFFAWCAFWKGRITSRFLGTLCKFLACLSQCFWLCRVFSILCRLRSTRGGCFLFDFSLTQCLYHLHFCGSLVCMLKLRKCSYQHILTRLLAIISFRVCVPGPRMREVEPGYLPQRTQVR